MGYFFFIFSLFFLGFLLADFENEKRGVQKELVGEYSKGGKGVSSHVRIETGHRDGIEIVQKWGEERPYTGIPRCFLFFFV